MDAADTIALQELGEWFAAGYFELLDHVPMRRWSRAVRRRFEHRDLTPYTGTLLYPGGPRRPPDSRQNQIVEPSYSFTWAYHPERLRSRLATVSAPAHRRVLQSLEAAMTELNRQVFVWDSPHTVGGRGYTHSIPNYGRVLREGLNAYADRIRSGRRAEDKRDFYLGLEDVIAGIGAWHRRILSALASWSTDDVAQARRRDRLVAALQQVPFRPARSFYEAVVAYNFVFYLDDCDNPGRLDRELIAYYREDVTAGRIDRDAALALLREFTDNVCSNEAWSAAIGGSLPDGAPAYNEVTELCLDAVHYRHRPSYELGVRPDMPESVWDAALDAVATGCGQPAFYNEPAYLEALRAARLGLSEEDVVLWNGGGCTETMIHGRSNVGSLDAGLHLPLVLEGAFKRRLATASSFDTLLAHVKADVAATVREITEGISALQKAKAALVPQPMRSLLIDDCIDRGVEFNAGGARYNWSVVNVAGLANVVDSLAAVRELVFETRKVSGAELLEVLARDFADDEALRQRLRHSPHFGNDDPRADDLAVDLAHVVFSEFRRYVPWRGGRFLPSCIMFTTYAAEGAKVGATADGRRAGEPLADSIGPAAGRDRHGPTAMIRSVTRLPLQLATGTPVLNIRFSKALLTSCEGRQAVRNLLETYFELGGMQIQLSVLDRDVLEDALVHPERHEDLIVRVGGFSAYFTTLSPELQRSILERTEQTF